MTTVVDLSMCEVICEGNRYEINLDQNPKRSFRGYINQLEGGNLQALKTAEGIWMFRSQSRENNKPEYERATGECLQTIFRICELMPRTYDLRQPELKW